MKAQQNIFLAFIQVLIFLFPVISKAKSEKPNEKYICVDYDGGEKSEIIKNPWIKSVKKESTYGPYDAYKVTYKNDTHDDGVEKIIKIDCKKGIAIFEHPTVDCGDGNFITVVSLDSGKKLIPIFERHDKVSKKDYSKRTPLFQYSSNLKYFLSVDNKDKVELKLCKKEEGQITCKALWSDKVWKGSGSVCLEKGEEPECEFSCGGAYFIEQNSFNVHQSKQEGLNCKIDEEANKVSCRKKKFDYLIR